MSSRFNGRLRHQNAFLLAAAVGLLASSLSRSAAAYQKIGQSGGGQLSAPDIVPLFWGNWPTSGDPDDQPHMQAYLRQFASYVSGAVSPREWSRRSSSTASGAPT